jgi:molybdenum cofactor cytidylyltransferase
MAVAAIVLAAGESTRMGRPKALLDWRGRTLLQHQIATLSEAGCDPVVVVLGARAHQIRARTQCDAPCRIVENAAYRSGRASSLRIGARALADDVEAVLIASVDGPSALATTAAVIEAWRENAASIVVPRFEGRNGHPALFDGALLGELRELQESTLGLKAVRTAHADATQFVDCDDPWVVLNMNTPEEYEQARAAHGGASSSSS